MFSNAEVLGPLTYLLAKDLGNLLDLLDSDLALDLGTSCSSTDANSGLKGAVTWSWLTRFEKV